MLRKALLVFSMCVLPLPLGAQKSARDELSTLFSLIDQADEMVVYSEGFKRESVLYRSSNRKDFEDLKSAITLKPKGRGFACACIDGPEIALLKDKQEIATLWNHEGTAIGSSVWGGEWENQDSDRWLRWFGARGMSYARQFFNQVQLEQRNEVIDEERWMNAMPASLRPLWSKARSQYNPPLQFPDLRPLNAALAQQYPEADDRIRALLAWFGSGAGPWSGFPGYEEIAAKLLRQYPTEEAIRAVDGRILSDQELEGTARLLGSWTPIPDRTPIPTELRHALLEHCLKSSDQDKKDRARKAFDPEHPTAE
jgi:hypothetical protein